MDLGAYVQIDNLEQVMKDNCIEVPRLRGLRLMKDEEKVTDEEMREMYANAETSEVEQACRSGFHMKANWATYSWETDILAEYYINFAKKENGSRDHFNPIEVRWDRLHGKKRKVCKYRIKKRRKKIKKQFEMWNKYCGRDDVLYIHARIGGGNWNYFNCDKVIKQQPWYLDHCEDYHDCTYVDIYAKINGEKKWS